MHCFQGKTPKSKYWVVKVLCLETQIVGSAWLKNDSLCVYNAHQNVVLLVHCLGHDIQRPADQEDRLQH